MRTPKDLGFYFPAEWHTHEATWLSFPQNVDTWEDRFERIFPSYLKFIQTIALSEKVRINGNNEATINIINQQLEKYEISKDNIEIFDFKTNDSWCRDHGPAFLVNQDSTQKMLVNWGYNAWGGKYPPFEQDDAIPLQIAEALKIPFVTPGIIMEGGSVEFNGAGTVMTSESCLLNKNRNPHLSKIQIEKYLCDFYGVDQVLWIKDGIVGDDTDGHIDDTVRFVNENTVITMVESDKNDANYNALQENLKDLKQMRLLNQKPLNIIEIQMPDAVIDKGERLPASYANFCITNSHVIVPTYRSKKDDLALQILQDCFKTRQVVGIDSTEIIWGLGSFHCLSQQEPKI